MKKSTVLLLVVVYIASFFIIGLLGASIKNYDPVVEPESIELIDPNNIADVEKDVKNGNEVFDYYFRYWDYKEGDTLTIKAIVKPDNTSYQDVVFGKDAQNTDFTFITNKDDPTLDNGYARFSLNVQVNPVVSARFIVSSTNPGVQISIKACIVFTTLSNPKAK